ncbi:hypothetical protein ES703_111282 [subsurface metagenome]
MSERIPFVHILSEAKFVKLAIHIELYCRRRCGHLNLFDYLDWYLDFFDDLFFDDLRFLFPTDQRADADTDGSTTDGKAGALEEFSS